MIIKNISINDIKKALVETNKKFDDNIIFRYGIVTLNKKGTRHRLTITVKSTKEKGHALGLSLTSRGNRRRLAAACYHAHGVFFDEILEAQPKAVIQVSYTKSIIYKDGGTVIGNWNDFKRENGGYWNNYKEVWASELCEC